MCLPVICCVYVSTDSYLSVHTNPSMEAHELLRVVGQKMDKAEEDMVLAVMSQTGGTLTNTQQWMHNTCSTDCIKFLLQKANLSASQVPNFLFV